jgi:antitoxin VapB
MGAHATKTFKSGNSEAVRLPQGVGFGIGVAVHIERDGDRVVITPARNPAEEKARLLALLADLEAIGAPPGGVQKREPFEFPERPGL